MPQDARFDVNAISGFPYYSGDMTFSQKVTFDQKGLPDRFDLAFDFGDTCYDCLELKLNGISLGVRPFTPYRWSCRKEWVANGENDLELIRTNTLANMLDGTCFDYENHQLVHI